MSQQYEVSEVPEGLLNQALAGPLRVEFLGYGGVVSTGDSALDAEREGKKKNHVVFSVNFAQPVGQALSVRISMDVLTSSVGSNEAVYTDSDHSDGQEVNGRMNVKTLLYSNPSYSAIKTFNFNISEGLTL